MAAADDPPAPPGPPGPPYLLGLRLSGRRVVVVGGGRVADRRVPALVRAGASVVVISPSVTAALEGLAVAGQIRWVRRGYAQRDVEGAWLVQACTSDPQVNNAIAADCEAAMIWCVRADDRAASPAWTPASGEAGDAHIAVLTGDPRRSAGIRDAVVSGLRDGTIGARRGRGTRTPGYIAPSRGAAVPHDVPETTSIPEDGDSHGRAEIGTAREAGAARKTNLASPSVVSPSSAAALGIRASLPCVAGNCSRRRTSW
jgi:siroheme synthase (precorrin-2 oxidase/ferrochelatase)